MKVNDIVETNYWKADKTYRQKRLPTLEPDPVDNAEPFDVSKHDQPDDHSAEIDVNNAQMRAAITQLLLKLSPRMERMLRERFFQGLTLEQISQKYGISRERIRQIEAKALRILKHPSRSKQLKSMLQTSTSEAANPAQQAAIAISMKKAGKTPKDDMDEAKQRLDPKCWTGYHKAGTKMKGDTRVNNCVPNESVVKEFAPDESPERNDDGRPQFMEWSDFIAAVANLTKSSFDVKQGFKNKKLEKKQAVAKFIPHDPYEHGPVMLYAYRDSRPPHRIGIKANMQVGTYTKHNDQTLTQYKIPTNNLRSVNMTPENATMIAHAIMKNTTGALHEAAGVGYIPAEESVEEDLTPDEQFDMIEEMVEELALHYGVDSEEIWEHFESVDDNDLFEAAAWQKSSGKNKNGGLNQKGVNSYRREHPGSKLQTAVTTKPSKLKKGSKASKRRKSFCARMKGMKKHRTGSKTAHDPNSRINKSLRKWNC